MPSPGTQVFNSCVGWAVGYGMLGYQYKVIEGNANYNGSDKIFSAAFIWNQCNGGINSGISLSTGLKFVKEKGCCKWIDMPANVNSYTIQPSATAKANAANYKLSEFMKFRTVDVNKIKFYVSRNYPIPFGVEVDAGFMNGKDTNTFDKHPDGRLVWKNRSGPIVGGHAMLICGYDDNINAFKVLNSWGTTWGNAGFIWIDYNFLSTVILRNTSLSQPEIYLGLISTVKDIDGNMYQTVKIGTQVWLVGNLKVTHYRNGDAIPNVTSNTQWSALTTGAFCHYNNDANVVNTYGHLYNWYALNDFRKIAPAGWHVANDAEWDVLINYLGGTSVAGGKLKEAGLAHWVSPNAAADNSSGFKGLPGGIRACCGAVLFEHFSGTGWHYSSTAINDSTGRMIGLSYADGKIYISGAAKKVGSSVRCIRD